MRQQQITTPEAGFVEYPNKIAFMYSRQPVIVQCGDSDTYPVAVTVTCDTNGGASYTERRRLHKGRAEFDISRIMQLLAQGPDTLLERLNAGDASLAEIFSITVKIADTVAFTLERGIQALYGALDAGEVYGKSASVRIYTNYPQTVNIWRGSQTAPFTIAVNNKQHTIEKDATAPDCCELDIKTLLGDDWGKIQKAGQTIALTSWQSRLENGQAILNPIRGLTLVPDNTPAGCGTYLRWLNRRGEVSYWHFDNAQLETAGAVAESFGRYYEGDPSTPSNGGFKNEDKRNFEETRRQTLTSTGVTDAEFETLCDLQVSPVVEMLGKDGTLWHRVNVDAGTQSRRNRRDTPRLHDFEISITLPKRNTIQL